MATSKNASFTDAERAAVKERARELKAEARAEKKKADGERDVLATLAKMPPRDRALGERVHAIVTSSAPTLTPKLWYGQPAYARDGKVVCFFQAASKYGTKYATFGFSDEATLEEDTLWPTAFALKGLSADDEAQLSELVRRAVS